MKRLERLRLVSRIIFFIFLIGVIFVNQAQAQIDELSVALNRLSSNVKMIKLANGLRVIMYKRGTAPVFSGVVTVRVGGSDEKVGQTGISHMLEHMAFKGTTKLGTKDYKKEKKLLKKLEELSLNSDAANKLSEEQKVEWNNTLSSLKKLWDDGTVMHAYSVRGATDLNATTGKDLTTYMVSLPKSAFEFWCWMESERILNPVMRQFYQERDVVIEERFMRFENSPSGALYEMLLGEVYKLHPYRHPVIGYPQDISRLTASGTDEFRKQYYVPSNIVLSIVGDLDYPEDLKMIEKYFGGIPIGKQPIRPSEVEPPQTSERRVVFKAPASPEMYVVYRKPNYPHPDDAPISVMSEILAGSRISPMHRELVQRSQVATSIGYEETPGYAYPNAILFAAEAKAPFTNRALLEKFDKEISKFISMGVTEEQLKIAKHSIAMDYLSNIRSNLSLAQDLGSAEILYPDGWNAMVSWFNDAMKVTTKDVHSAAKKYLTPSTRTLGFIEPKL